MKITLRLVISLAVTAGLAAAAFAYLQVENERDRLFDELHVRESILAESLRGSVRDLLTTEPAGQMNQLVERFENRGNLIGIALHDSLGKVVAVSQALKPLLRFTSPYILEALVSGRESTGSLPGAVSNAYVLATPVHIENRTAGVLLILEDASYIGGRLQGIWQRDFLRLLAQALIIVVITMIVMRWTIAGPIAQLAEWMRGVRTGVPGRTMVMPRANILAPLAREVSMLASSLAVARATARTEARLRVQGESLWTAERLKEHVRQELGSKNLFVVSNREPYMHVRRGGSIECIVPPGGLVTALDPILQACGGMWIACGDGDADREMTDENGHLQVPPDYPSYTLKRLFIPPKVEDGYYYGFSNEGIWPLCHITHTRPVFRLDDWVSYQKVNEQFAEAVLGEIEHQAEPLVLVQDYHFALLPLLIKARRPDARVAIFWHIPWPNPEVFGICPWKREILLGLLGADLVGFHIQFHCNNFLDTIDRFLESQIDWDQYKVQRQGSETSVQPFPISVAFPPVMQQAFPADRSSSPREMVSRTIGFLPKYLAVGVDRVDYTKGIVERLKAVERFLEKYPEYIGQFTFVELGAPSRSHIKRYHDLMAEIEETIEKINARFRVEAWTPIVFLKAVHGHDIINAFYATAGICMVTSLHDGMNLVAKEFIAARDDESGVLILSQFTGASRELKDALIVNPYDIEELADAVHTALTMQPKEVRERMVHLREVIRDRNVYRWAGSIISTLSRVRLPKTPVGVQERS